MKIVRFNALGEPVARARTGVLLPGGRVGDLRAAYAACLIQDGRDGLGREIAALRIPPDVRQILHHGVPAREAMERAAAWLAERGAAEPGLLGVDGEALLFPLANVRLHNPLKPGRLVLVIGNSQQSRAAPVVVQRASAAVMGPVRDIELPAGLSGLHYGTGLAIVIGRNCHRIDAAAAADAIAGYMTANEIRSASGVTELGGDSAFGRYIIGPALVSAHEVPGIATQALSTRVNGTLVQSGSLADLQLPIADLVARLSQLGLEAGDVIITGLLSEAAPVDQAKLAQVVIGDRIESTVEGLGSTNNRVVAAA